MRKRKRMEFSKKLIIYTVAFLSLCMLTCLVGMFFDKDISTIFVSLCGLYDSGIIAYYIKAYKGKKQEEENNLFREMNLKEEEENDPWNDSYTDM